MSNEFDDKPAVLTTSGGTVLRDPYVGRTLGGKYRILERLGQGGMGAVYKGEHTLVERTVAVKILHAHLLENETFLMRFHQEARVMSKISHPNAVTLFDFGVEEEIPYLVLEFIHGRTLKDIISERGAFTPERTRDILQQVTGALGAAHALGIVHRDLKPDNIMLTSDSDGSERVRVLDFGIAKLLSHSGEQRSTVATQAGTLMGTPEYVSPEQAMEKELDSRADIYSLGVILYEMLSGRVPFTSVSPLEIYVQHIRNSPPPIPSIAPELNIPPPVSAVVERCLEKDPANRYQSVVELVHAFTNALSARSEELDVEHTRLAMPAHQDTAQVQSAHPSPAAPSSSPTRTPRPSVFNRKGALLSGAAIAAVLVGGVIVKSTFQPDDQTQSAMVQPAQSEPAPAEPELAEAPAPVIHAEARALSPNSETVIAEQILPVEPPSPEPSPEPVSNRVEAPVVSSEAVEPPLVSSGAVEPESVTAALTAELLGAVDESAPEPSVIDLPAQLQTETTVPTSGEVSALLGPLAEESELRGLPPAKARAAARKAMGEGEKLLDNKSYLEAGLKFRTVLALEEKNLPARLNYALVLLRLGHPELAEEEFKRALALDPQYAPSHYGLASSYALAGKADLAFESLSSAIRLFPGAKKWVADDRDFDPIRLDPRFGEITR